MNSHKMVKLGRPVRETQINMAANHTRMCTLKVNTNKLQIKIIKMDRFLLENLTGFSQEIPYSLWNAGFSTIFTFPYPGPHMNPENETQ